MIDIHVHGSHGADVMDATFESYKKMSDFFVTRGVTSFLATALTMPDPNFFAVLENVRSILRDGNLPGAEVLGVHLEGPFLNPAQKGCHPVDLLMLPTPERYKPYLEYADVVKEMTLAPELAGAPRLVADLRDAGILAAAGHTDGIVREMMPAIDAGITHAVHFFCNMGHFRRDDLKRVAGAMETLLYDDRVSTELIADGWHIGDTIMKLTVKVKGVDRVCFVTDAMTAAGMPPGRYFIGNVEAIVEDGIARLPDNTAYASSVTTMDVCVRNGVNRMDLDIKDAVRMATLTPAEIIGVNDRKGCIEKGKDADIVVMDGDANIKLTIARGKLVYESEK
jgi:N-acetylglucosamine-6-phosphate deacetylase